MNNAISMSAEFERRKNFQASVYTAAITGAILLMIILVKLTTPVKTEPPVDEFVEIELPNLGNSEVGSGTDQPLLPGDPAPDQQTAYTPPQPVHASEEAVKDVSNDDERSNDAPPVTKPVVSKTDAKKINTEVKTVKTKNTTPQDVVQAPPRPKATLGRTVGGNGNGGNGADTYKPGTGEGQGGGPGDQGVVGGDPNGKKYTGNPRNFGVKVLSIPNQSFEDDFNQNAKVAMDIVVNDDGKVTAASYQPRGSTTSDRKYIDIARRSAFQLKMGNVDGGQKGTVIFNFKVRG